MSSVARCPLPVTPEILAWPNDSGSPRVVSRRRFPGNRQRATGNESLPLQHHRHAHPARGADGDEAVPLARELKLVTDGGHDAGAGGAEGEAEGDRSAGEVDLLGVDVADGVGAAEFFLGDFLRSE